MFSHPMTNKEALAEMDKLVYGHTRAKKILINAINRSRIRWHQEFNLGMDFGLISNKNVLLMGASGTGKTFLIESLQKVCDFPLLTYNCTELVPPSHKGVNIQKIINDVKTSCSDWATKSGGRFNSSEVMRQQVVFLDEVDKLAMVTDSTGNWNKSLQSALLQLLENKTELQGVTFVLAGAFTSISRETVQSKQLGFVSVKHAITEKDYDKEIIKAGLIPELVGRIGAVVHLDILKKADYISLLDNYVLPRVYDELNSMGIYNFFLEAEERDSLIVLAMKSEQGVRFLYKEVQKLVESYEFDFEDYSERFFSELQTCVDDIDYLPSIISDDGEEYETE